MVVTKTEIYNGLGEQLCQALKKIYENTTTTPVRVMHLFSSGKWCRADDIFRYTICSMYSVPKGHKTELQRKRSNGNEKMDEEWKTLLWLFWTKRSVAIGLVTVILLTPPPPSKDFVFVIVISTKWSYISFEVYCSFCQNYLYSHQLLVYFMYKYLSRSRV